MKKQFLIGVYLLMLCALTFGSVNMVCYAKKGDTPVSQVEEVREDLTIAEAKVKLARPDLQKTYYRKYLKETTVTNRFLDFPKVENTAVSPPAYFEH